MEITEGGGRLEVALDETATRRADAGAQLVEDGPPGQATFDGEDPPTARLADLEDVREGERRPRPAQIGDQTVPTDDVVGTATAVEDPQHPVVAEGVHPGFTSVAQAVVGGDSEAPQERDESGVGGEVHPHSLNDAIWGVHDPQGHPYEDGRWRTPDSKEPHTARCGRARR